MLHRSIFTLVSSVLPSPLAPKSNTSNTVGSGVFSSPSLGGGAAFGGGGVFCFDLLPLLLLWWLFPFFFDREEDISPRLFLQCDPTLLALQLSMWEHHITSTINSRDVKLLKLKPPIFSFWLRWWWWRRGVMRWFRVWQGNRGGEVMVYIAGRDEVV